MTDQEVNDILQDLNFEFDELNSAPAAPAVAAAVVAEDTPKTAQAQTQAQREAQQNQDQSQGQGVNGVTITRGHLMEDVLLSDLNF